MTGKVIPLGRARKQRARAEAEAVAAENRVRFGRTKAEKQADRVEAERARRAREGAELEPKD